MNDIFIMTNINISILGRPDAAPGIFLTLPYANFYNVYSFIHYFIVSQFSIIPYLPYSYPFLYY